MGDRVRRTSGVATATALVAALVVAPSEGLGGTPEFVERLDGRSLGVAGAPILLVEYSDFTCGFCRKFHDETWPRIQARYVDTGKVRFLYRDYPRAFQGPGLNAALGSRCADEQGRFWPMHDRLFRADGRLGMDDLRQYATELGLDSGRFSRCLNDARYSDDIFANREEGVNFGFRGTPGFLLLRTRPPRVEGGAPPRALVIPGAFPYQVFEEQIERLLAEREPRVDG